MRTDAVNAKKIVQVLAPAARTADANGTVDTQGFHKITLLFSAGAEGITLDGTNYLQFKVEHSDASGSGFADVAAEDIIVPANAAAMVQAPASGVVCVLNDNAEAPAVYAVGYVGAKRYVKVTADHVGTHGAATPYEVLAILEAPEFAPAA